MDTEFFRQIFPLNDINDENFLKVLNNLYETDNIDFILKIDKNIEFFSNHIFNWKTFSETVKLIILKVAENHDFESFSFLMRDLDDFSNESLVKNCDILLECKRVVKDEKIELVHSKEFVDNLFKFFIMNNMMHYAEIIKNFISKALLEEELYKSYKKEKLQDIKKLCKGMYNLEKLYYLILLLSSEKKFSHETLKNEIDFDSLIEEFNQVKDFFSDENKNIILNLIDSIK